MTSPQNQLVGRLMDRWSDAENGIVRLSRELLGDAIEVLRKAVPLQPQLTVWEGSMPESNGKSNFTALLCRKDGGGLMGMADEHTIAISEYPGRVKYEADRVRYLIGELAERPDILAYDADVHSDYKPRDHECFISYYDLRKLMQGAATEQGISGGALIAALEERMETK